MEYYENRIESFGPAKSKRTKASSSKPVWPHPSSFKATPKTLAEAGFYFNPDSDNNDNVACFTCGKNLAGWEPDDDPFTIHYEKCRDKCAWAVVRCQRALGDGSFDFSDPTRHPTSKTMEKARLETFSNARWPHDAVKGHGANSKVMAKAGFLCIPTEAGDDTVLCLYCELSLSGWDNDDDPYEEHVKRDRKKRTSCPFIKAHSGHPLSKSATKRPASKAATKPPAQSSKAVAAKEVAENVDDSDDELATMSPSTDMKTTSKGRASKASSARASSIAKTPASRRSTRGTSATGKTPGSRTVSSEVEETDAGSESDAGRRTAKSKRKADRQTKARVSAIAEEEDEAESSRPTQEAEEDVEMDDVHKPEPEKKRRSRPAKSVAAKPAAKGKPKKAGVKVEEEQEEDVEVDSEPPSPRPAKKTHARTRSKAIPGSDTEVAAPPKGTHKRTKSTSKTKVKRDEDETENEMPAVVAPASKKKGKQRAAETVEDEQDPPSALPKAKTVSHAKPQAKYEGSEDEDILPAAEDPSRNRANGIRSTTSHESKVASERKSSLSDDAGYATAEAHPEVDPMEVDDELAGPPPKPTKKMPPPASKASQPPPRANPRLTPSGSDGSQRPSPAVNGVRSSSAAPPSSLTSSSRPPSKLSVARMSTQDSLKVIEIDSDAEASPERPAKPQPKTMAPSTLSVDGVTRPASQAQKKKLQVEVMMPSKATKLPSSDDAQMRDERLASPPPRPPRSPSRPTKPEMPAPDTPVSAVHRSTHPSPEHGLGGDEDVPVTHGMDAVPAASSSPRTYHPFLARFPVEKLISLTEEETDMTLEQYIRREMEVQYAQLKADGERRIEEFKQKAAETRKLIGTP